MGHVVGPEADRYDSRDRDVAADLRVRDRCALRAHLHARGREAHPEVEGARLAASRRSDAHGARVVDAGEERACGLDEFDVGRGECRGSGILIGIMCL